MPIHTKRIYDPPAAEDGHRILVDRVWPRGIKKADARLDAWLKDIAPSTDLRKWFGHDPAKWDEFQRHYFAELDEKPDTIADLKQRAKSGPLTLLYAAKDTEHNNAAALKAYLESR